MLQTQAHIVDFAPRMRHLHLSHIRLGVGHGDVEIGTDSPILRDYLCPLQLEILSLEFESDPVVIHRVVAGDLRSGRKENTPSARINGDRFSENIQLSPFIELNESVLRRKTICEF